MPITLAAAQKVVNEIVQKVLTHPSGRKAIVVVSDSHGEVIALARMDGAPLSSLPLAQNKAYTAARAARPSKQMGIEQASGVNLANFGDARLTGFGGGVPVYSGSEIIAAVGISGLAEEDDIVLATWAAEQLGG